MKLQEVKADPLHHPKSSAKDVLVNWSEFDVKIIFEGTIIGALTGLIVVLFRLCLDQADLIRHAITSQLTPSFFTIATVVAVLAVLGIILGRFVTIAPNIKGSGIPQIKGFLMRQVKLHWLKELILKFIGGIIALGVGLSAGREGPSVQLGATAGLGFSQLFKRFHIEEKYLVTAGASAGLAAAFNAPLAGVLFALEELHKNISPIMLTCILSAAVTSDFIAGTVFGLDPVLRLDNMVDLPLNYYGLIILLGLLAAFMGKGFNGVLVRFMKALDTCPIPTPYLPLLPMMVAAILYFAKPDLLGGGHDLIMSLTDGKSLVSAVVLLFVFKLFFTALTYSSKVPGGIFLPLLSLGAILGYVIGQVGIQWLNMDNIYLVNFLALGMVAFFTSVVKAPLSGSVLISEMTGSFDHLLPIILVALVSHVVTDMIHSKPVYDVLLENMLESSAHADESNYLKKDQDKKSLLEIPVVFGSEVEHQRIADIRWPEKCLMISIKRGDQELIPKGSYKLYAGDHLVFLTEYSQDLQLMKKLTSMANDISPVKHGLVESANASS